MEGFRRLEPSELVRFEVKLSKRGTEAINVHSIEPQDLLDHFNKLKLDFEKFLSTPVKKPREKLVK